MTDLASMLLHSRTQAHVFHLRVSPRGLAPHLGLQEYYDSIVGLVDGMVEPYQGMMGLIEIKAVKGIDNEQTYLTSNGKDKYTRFPLKNTWTAIKP